MALPETRAAPHLLQVRRSFEDLETCTSNTYTCTPVKDSTGCVQSNTGRAGSLPTSDSGNHCHHKSCPFCEGTHPTSVLLSWKSWDFPKPSSKSPTFSKGGPQCCPHPRQQLKDQLLQPDTPVADVMASLHGRLTDLCWLSRRNLPTAQRVREGTPSGLLTGPGSSEQLTSPGPGLCLLPVLRLPTPMGPLARQQYRPHRGASQGTGRTLGEPGTGCLWMPCLFQVPTAPSLSPGTCLKKASKGQRS